MPYRIGGKFVTKEAYEAHQKGKQVSETTETETTEKKTRNVSPRVAAFRRLARAEKTLAASKKFWEGTANKPTPPPVDEAQAEYDAAAEQVKGLI